jgi:hypothetical protein
MVTAAGIIKYAIRRLAKDYPSQAEALARASLMGSTEVSTLGIRRRGTQTTLAYNEAYIVGLSVDRCAHVLLELLSDLEDGDDDEAGDFPPSQAEVADHTSPRDEPQEAGASPGVDEPEPVRPELTDDKDEPNASHRLASDQEAQDEPFRSKGESSSGEGCSTGGAGPGGPAPGDACLVVAEVGTKTGERGAAAQAQDDEDLEDLEAEDGGEDPDRNGMRSLLGSDAGPRLGWKELLRAFVARARKRVLTYTRPPRRSPHLIGIVPGKISRQGRLKVLAAIDTSGSMTQEFLEAIVGELRVLDRQADIMVIECDTQVRRVSKFRHDILSLRGGGGTDLRPPFEARLLLAHRPDALLYFTDGEGPAPSTPPRVPVLWVLLPGGVRPASWGQAVQMDL